MVDRFSKEVRSKIMASITSKNTRPELAIRKGLHRMGFRYSLHSGRFRGHPDLLLPKYKAAIFIHGCYWHGHGCTETKPASSNKEYWGHKINRNRERDKNNQEAILAAGWRFLVIWECSIRRKGKIVLDEVIMQVAMWLKDNSISAEIYINQSSLIIAPLDLSQSQ
ncbi:very short patch repair endonuclease [Brucella anthropi]|uniref:very short patch repair endonuclease n=1 Tax=Brucella anthropi TaxID=529 RepID=UPI00124E2E8C|nr:very short patch repair endonuclease [Brucella anthropi]KAB2783169.1 DNA mismatch endonuclease Vsr [Brucella anthropi]